MIKVGHQALATEAMSNHEEDDVENAERGIKSTHVKLDEPSITEIHLCLQFSAPKGTSDSSLESANEDMQRLNLKVANKGSSDELCEDADECVSKIILGLNRPSFQPLQRLGTGLRFKCGGTEATGYRRFVSNDFEGEDYEDEYVTQIAAEELEDDGAEDAEEGEVSNSSSVSNSTLDFSGADGFDYIDEESAAEDEDVGDARMPGGTKL